jgi:predicted HAD superfamily phosphohydrolase YqeG
MLEIIKPTIATGAFFSDIDPERLIWQLRRRGPVKAGSIDLDSTIIPQNDMVPSEENMAIIRDFFELGVPLGINSNAGSEERGERVTAIAANLSERVGEDMVAVSTYTLGGPWYLRKPFPKSYNEVARRMGVYNHEMFHIDDQAAKGALGANLAGYHSSVHVEPCAPETDPRGVRLVQRPIETELLRHWGAPFGMEEGAAVVRVTADFYRKVERASYAGALAAAAIGLREVRKGNAAKGLLIEAGAARLVEAGVDMGNQEKHQRAIEGLIDLSLQPRI